MEDAARLLESIGHQVEEIAPDWHDDLLAEHFVRAWIAGVKARVDQLGLLRGRAIAPDELEPLTAQMCERAAGISSADYIASVGYLRSSSRRISAFWQRNDVLLTPTLAQPPPRNGALAPGPDEQPLEMLRKAGDLAPFTAPWNVTGQPAISLPLSTSPDGLPIGVQLVGRDSAEATLLALGAQLEQVRPWRERRPAVTAA
jgi:amidase